MNMYKLTVKQSSNYFRERKGRMVEVLILGGGMKREGERESN